ncbi:MAG: septal ring lytic transglycosylase RlpA family protein [Propionibacteriaceae bacterium]|jgi:rare lipoprotein A|nr:septal ring lytic transglycosylase RlpA family protein [Propionibacteriaceae bacterium]
MGSRLAVSITASALVGGLSVGLIGLVQEAGHDVLIVDHGQVTVITMWGGQVGDALAWAKVSLAPGDSVRPSVEQSVSGSLVVVIDRPASTKPTTASEPAAPSRTGFVPALPDCAEPTFGPSVYAVLGPVAPGLDQPGADSDQPSEQPADPAAVVEAAKQPTEPAAQPPVQTTPARPTAPTSSAPPAAPTTPANPTPPPPTTPTTPDPPPASPPPTTPVNSCRASYYNQGKVTANGEAFNPQGLTAAHRTLPFNTRVLVTNPANGLSVVVRINDRGPFIEGRCLDLAEGAFRQIADTRQGVVTVQWQVL